MNWPHIGWLSHTESLQLPLHVYPGPSLKDYFDHYQRANSLTVLLTGRMDCVRSGVEGVLKENNLNFARITLKPEESKRTANERRKGNAVYQYKKEYVQSLLKEFPQAEVLKFWDDREDNIKMIKSLKSEFKNVKFDVIHVKEQRPNFFQMSLQNVIDKLGLGQTAIYNAAVEEGMSFIAKAWCDVVNANQQENNLLPFGSYLLQRKSDVDLCILAPKDKSVDHYIQALGEKLQSFGVQYCYVATGIRCPRVKIKFEYLKAPPVEFDVIVAAVLENSSAANVNVRDLYKQNSDKKSKNSLEGLIFFEDVVKPTLDKISTKGFGLIIDVLSLVLSKNHMKGNAFHCIRTFHLVQLLSKFILVADKDLLPSDCFQTLHGFKKFLMSFFTYLSEMPFAEWHKLFKSFVPDIYIKPLQEFFRNTAQSSVTDLLFTGPKSTSWYNSITVQVKTNDPVLEWKAMVLTEARLGSCIRKLIEYGLEVYPGYVTDNAIIFGTSSIEKCKAAVETFAQDLESELSNGVCVNVRFDK